MYSLILGCCIVVGYVAFKILRVPRGIRQIPSLTTYNWILSMMEEKPFDVKIRETVMTQLHSTKLTRMLSQGKWVVVTSSLESAKRIFSELDVFPKSIPREKHPNILFSKFMGVNLVFSNHDDWKRIRRIVNPLFKQQMDLGEVTGVIRKFIGVIDSNNIGVDISKYTQKITMDVMGKAIMGLDFNSVEKDKVTFIDCYNEVFRSASEALYLILPKLDNAKNPFRKHAYNSLKKLEGIFNEIIADKREMISKSDHEALVNNPRTDVLTRMLLECEKDNFSDKEIRDNIMIFLLAGHDTTSFTIATILHFLAIFPQVQSQLREEIFTVMGIDQESSDNINEPNHEQIKQFTYMVAVIKEAMRLYPPVTRLPFRSTSKETELDGYVIPANTEVTIDLYSMQRDPAYFTNPDQFIPERFLELNKEGILVEKKDILCFHPFGGGTRHCIGSQLAMLELKLFLCMVISRYQIKYTKGLADKINPHSPSSLKLKSCPFFFIDDVKFDFVPLCHL